MFETRCINCNEFVVPRELMEEFEAINGQGPQREVVTQMWTENENFRKDLIDIQKQGRVLDKQKKILDKQIKEIKTDYKEKTAPYIEMLRTIVKDTQKKIRSLNEYKEKTKVENKYLKMLKNTLTKWGIRMYVLRGALEGVEGAAKYIPKLYYRRPETRNFRIWIR